MAKATFDPTEEGFGLDGRVMENNERRIRLRMPDSSAYIRTEAGPKGAWQNAHHHQGMEETYIVHSGWMAYAEAGPTGRIVNICRPGEVFTSKVGIDHNVYLPAGAVIHTVQHGTPVGNPEKKGNDWYAADDDFDAWSKSIKEKDLLKLDTTTIGDIL